MIKNIALASLLVTVVSTTVMAEEHKSSGAVYIVAKGLYTLGETLKEDNGVELEGKAGGGFGFDIGYTLPHSFAVEWDNSYSTNDVTIGSEEESMEFWTTALDLTYTYHLTHHFGVMGKIGYEYEQESIGSESKDDNGMVYGAALEYEIDEHFGALVEYEGSMIDSARGDSIYAGVKYTF